MSADLIKQEWRLVVEQRGDDPAAIDRKPYRTVHFPKATEEKAIKGLADWEENKQNILDAADGRISYVVNWAAYVEGRQVRETPWVKLET